MQQYARKQTATLLRRLAFQVSRAEGLGDADAVHDLRVAIRRFSRCLRVFSQFYPGRHWKKIRLHLRELMRAAGAVRDLDITLDLLGPAGSRSSSEIATHIREERRKAADRLSHELRLWKSRGYSKRWRTRLGL